LHREGFETFGNLWDESYDLIVSDRARFDAVTDLVLDTVQRYDRGELGIDAETQQKLIHNHARFFDKQLVEQRMTSEIFNTIKEFVE
jgi:hypothetical protein